MINHHTAHYERFVKDHVYNSLYVESLQQPVPAIATEHDNASLTKGPDSREGVSQTH